MLKKLRHSFQVKVIFVSIFFMLLTCVSLTIFYVHIHRASLNEELIQRARLLVGTLAHSAKVGIFSENTDLLSDPIEGVAEHKEVFHVALFNSSGRILAQLQKPPVTFTTPSGPAAEKIEDAFLEKLRRSLAPIYFSSHDKLHVWSAVFSSAGYSSEESLFFNDRGPRKKGNIIGFVNIVLSKEIFNQEIYDFIYKAILLTLLAILAASMVILYFINGITNPLRHLTQGIKKLGSEGITEKIAVKSEDEIGKLAMAFNELSESLLEKKAENISLEMQLRQIQKLEALGTLAGGIAHDFNNVLSPIIGFTEMAMEDIPEESLIYENLQEVIHAAIRARDLVKQILAFSRQSESERLPLKVQLIVKEALKLFKATLPATIMITNRINNDCKPILADPTDIHRIIMNLCTNAYQAMQDQKGVLHVGLDNRTIDDSDLSSSVHLPPGKYLELTVSDTGVGMDEGTLQKIFDPYFTQKPIGTGTGMGLAVVHGIVKSYNGEIQVHSEPGKGTTFQIQLPGIESDAETSEHLTGQKIQGGNEHILLVDDEIQIAHMVRKMLTRLGYEVTSRTNSIEALEAFTSQPARFDLVITDQTMPNMTGDELAIKLMDIRNDIPIIICTGFSEKITDEIVRKKGIRALVMKPLIKREIAKTIRQVLDLCEGEKKQGC